MSSPQHFAITNHKTDTTRRYRWLEKLMAIIALINLCLIIFDLSYVPWRNFYLRELPSLTQTYDQFKGIAPHRETTHYLQKVDELTTQVMETGLESPQTEELLESVRRLSNELIEDNPFAIANKTGSLEKIKNQFRDRLGMTSSHQAFNTFWSQTHLSQVGWQQEINFFNTHSRPLIQANYYRRIDTNGKFIDNFWLLDSPFIVLFGLEFLVRTAAISRQRPGLNWLAAMLRRWYDIFLLLPFWRWLRVIPVTVRLYQARLVNFEPIRAQIKYDFSSNFGEELTEIVGVRLIDQAQESIQRGEVARWLLRPETRKPYININNTNEIQAITARLLSISVYQVIPQVKPDIEKILHYSIENMLGQSQVYRQLQNVPGLNVTQLTEKLATDLSQTAYNTLTTTLADPVVKEMSQQLMQNFSKVLESELQKQHNLQEIEALVLDLLEEVKINYIKGIEAGGVEKSLAEASQLRQILR